MDLLLEVELPVIISFGRAQLMLKDAIKLTTGLIVETQPHAQRTGRSHRI